MSVGRRAWRPEQPVEGLLGGETIMETVLSRLSWVTGAVLGVPGVQVLWITVECAIDSISSFVPCVHCKRMATKKGKRLKTLTILDHSHTYGVADVDVDVKTAEQV